MRLLWRAAPHHLVSHFLPTIVNNNDNVDTCSPHTGTHEPVPLPQQPHFAQTLCPLSDTRVISVIIRCSVFQNVTATLRVRFQSHPSPSLPSARSTLSGDGKVAVTHRWVSSHSPFHGARPRRKPRFFHMRMEGNNMGLVQGHSTVG